jgi:hypothetical protein
MANRKSTKTQTMMFKTLNRKLKIDQNDPPYTHTNKNTKKIVGELQRGEQFLLH